MTELLTAAQMRAIEEAAIKSGDVTGLELMECAGQGVVDAVFEEWPELLRTAEQEGSPSHSPEFGGQNDGPLKAVVLCGPGNNGGDGFVVARLLKRCGWEVVLWQLAPLSASAEDALECEKQWIELGGATTEWEQLKEMAAPDLVVDAIFGTGLARPVPQTVADIFRRVRDQWQKQALKDGRTCRCVAVDIASGLSSDTGSILLPDIDPREGLAQEWPGFMDWVFHADLTVTFHNAKLGHFIGSGDGPTGKIVIKRLAGIPPYDSPWGRPVSKAGHVRLLEPKLFGRDRPLVKHVPQLQKLSGHKFDHGHALVLSGPPGQGGAARLAARGALRVGAGLVTVGCPMRAVTEHAIHLNAIMVRGLDGTHGLSELLEDSRINAVCLGPGLGLGPATADLVRNTLSSKRGTVLDADALSRFQRKPEILFESLHDNCVLTPHGGEFARLFPDIADKLEHEPGFSKVEATREAAKRAGCVVLFKGADTVIASSEGYCSVNASCYDQSAPWLATAGAGDVLAGVITGLLARGMNAVEAAQAGAWLHSESARSFGPGLIAEDLPEQLPKVFRSLGL
ncbi:NAD(P)H-hydrate dehydratase [uncultured Pelagimonas sp.]|uniref:NAD(P)H-hydrate dehydratase n=1 Tax=uncultured Pelagimonas sp. TaxID=1618102 RepID=UPI00260D3B1F|nr:NAD(P)H-hydrate dehydratase [uncultured Pelagimonas sp.]